MRARACHYYIFRWRLFDQVLFFFSLCVFFSSSLAWIVALELCASGVIELLGDELWCGGKKNYAQLHIYSQINSPNLKNKYRNNLLCRYVSLNCWLKYNKLLIIQWNNQIIAYILVNMTDDKKLVTAKNAGYFHKVAFFLTQFITNDLDYVWIPGQRKLFPVEIYCH